jgi:hypothetical protein
MRTGWTFHHYGGPEALYVYMTPPGSTEPMRFPCAGLGPAHRRVLRGLLRGDEVPGELLRALEVLELRHQGPPVLPRRPREGLGRPLIGPPDRGQKLK